MLTKILITLAVIIAAVLFIRHKNARVQQLAQQQQVEEQAADRRRAMIIAITLAVLTLLASVGIYSWHWQQDHQVVDVRVVNSHSGAVQNYQVYRADLGGRRFRTIDGVEIHLSQSERMEIMLP